MRCEVIYFSAWRKALRKKEKEEKDYGKII